jgi:hypothetical protein
MTTQTATLTDFLLARIAEDEATIPSLDCRCGTDGVPEVASLPDCPDRIVAECEAKRRIVEHADVVSDMDGRIEGEWGARGSVPWGEDEGVMLLRMLALPYADHPDYRPAWRP